MRERKREEENPGEHLTTDTTQTNPSGLQHVQRPLANLLSCVYVCLLVRKGARARMMILYACYSNMIRVHFAVEKENTHTHRGMRVRAEREARSGGRR